ncbi:MAG: polyphenol oxidase family protein [Phycisphaerae bacterium]|nr:polyphenol oxidase family protein [Phycisphaerae bacterium]
MGIEPGEVTAAIGPAIGRDFFMVNSDVTTALLRVELAEAIVHDSGRQDRVDLNLAVRRQLARHGVRQVDFGDYCTYRDKEEFFSHRRDSGRTGRMAAVIAPTCT